MLREVTAQIGYPDFKFVRDLQALMDTGETRRSRREGQEVVILDVALMYAYYSRTPAVVSAQPVY